MRQRPAGPARSHRAAGAQRPGHRPGQHPERPLPWTTLLVLGRHQLDLLSAGQLQHERSHLEAPARGGLDPDIGRRSALFHAGQRLRQGDGPAARPGPDLDGPDPRAQVEGRGADARALQQDQTRLAWRPTRSACANGTTRTTSSKRRRNGICIIPPVPAAAPLIARSRDGVHVYFCTPVSAHARRARSCEAQRSAQLRDVHLPQGGHARRGWPARSRRSGPHLGIHGSITRPSSTRGAAQARQGRQDEAGRTA